MCGLLVAHKKVCQVTYFKNINILFHRSSLPALPSKPQSHSFAKLFSDKIQYESILINRISVSPHFHPPCTPSNFSSFTCVTNDEVSKLPSQSPDTNCDLDSIPTFLETMFWYPTSHNHWHYQFIYLYWHMSWSIQKLLCTSSPQ